MEHDENIATAPHRRLLSNIIVRHDIQKRWYDESGLLDINIIDFLLDKARL